MLTDQPIRHQSIYIWRLVDAVIHNKVRNQWSYYGAMPHKIRSIACGVQTKIPTFIWRKSFTLVDDKK